MNKIPRERTQYKLACAGGLIVQRAHSDWQRVALAESVGLGFLAVRHKVLVFAPDIHKPKLATFYTAVKQYSFWTSVVATSLSPKECPDVRCYGTRC